VHEWIKKQPHGDESDPSTIRYRVVPAVEVARLRRELALNISVHNDSEVVDSLDDMQPVPRAGKFFAEQVLREEIRTEAGVILQEGEDPNTDDTRTKRARVLQLGPPREGEAWDFARGWEVIVPFHAGYNFEWMSRDGVTESLWIIDTNEVIALFEPRSV